MTLSYRKELLLINTLNFEILHHSRYQVSKRLQKIQYESSFNNIIKHYKRDWNGILDRTVRLNARSPKMKTFNYT